MATPAGFPAFRFVTAIRPGPHAAAVRWALQPSAWDLKDLAFIIFRSWSPAGPWDEMAETEAGNFQFVDHDIASAGINREPYYVVRIASRAGKGYLDSKPVRVEHDPDHISMEMVRKKTLFLEHRGGIGTAVLIRRRWGPKCNRCYSPEHGDASDAQCPECFGTGYTGGYYNPIEIPCLFNVPERQLVRAGIVSLSGTTYCELTNWPMLYPNDLLVDRTMNIRYHIDRVHVNAHRMYPVSQIASVTRLDDADIAYTIAVAGPPTHTYEARSYDSLNREEAGRGDPILNW